VSKVTFRADEDLIREVEALDASKSEVMREALRAYLDGGPGEAGEGGPDARLDERLDAALADRLDGASPPDVNVTINVEPPAGSGAAANVERGAASDREAGERQTGGGRDGQPRPDRGDAGSERTCNQCGEALSNGHVYCPNCGEKTANRLFCECGDEIRSDWAYCPSCGRRTPSADVLDG
jgi:hypothetical protein